MRLCIYNPEHDLCLAKGRANYVPPRSAVERARTDAQVMKVLYPDAVCCSVYDFGSSELGVRSSELDAVIAWGWDAVVKRELMKRGVSERLMPQDSDIERWRELQHRSTFAEFQEGVQCVGTVGEMERLLAREENWVMKAPWSGAGRGLRWVHGHLTEIDCHWIEKTVDAQRCVVAEPIRDTVIDFGIECYKSETDMEVVGYNMFLTKSGVYDRDCEMPDECLYPLPNFGYECRTIVDGVWRILSGKYTGPVGIDMMIDANGFYYLSEVNLRHTMGMVAHVKNNSMPWGF